MIYDLPPLSDDDVRNIYGSSDDLAVLSSAMDLACAFRLYVIGLNFLKSVFQKSETKGV